MLSGSDAGTANAFKDIVSDDPVFGIMSINSTNIPLRSHPCAVFQQAALHDTIVRSQIHVIGVIGHLNHLFARIEDMEIVNVNRINIELQLDGMLTDPPQSHATNSEIIAIYIKDVGYRAGHALTLHNHPVAITGTACDRYFGSVNP